LVFCQNLYLDIPKKTNYMKKILLTACSAMLLLSACNSSETKDSKSDSTSTAATTTEVKTEEAWVPVDSATMMKAMMDYGTPGDMHKILASWNGTWNGETTMWDYEGAEPKKSTGTAVNTMILGGHYQSSKHSGNMMGMPFEGMSITGYDNATKKFVSTWIDNWSTGIMSMSGNWDASAKTLTMSGTYPDICRPGKECSMREVFTVIDDNTQKMEMYGPDSKTGKEYKIMEITMTRKK
jgi:opacity protein-like surface antigen